MIKKIQSQWNHCFQVKDQNGKQMAPMSKLVTLKHCNDDWMTLMLKGFGQPKFFQCKITNGLAEAIKYCKDELKNDKWVQLIGDYHTQQK